MLEHLVAQHVVKMQLQHLQQLHEGRGWKFLKIGFGFLPLILVTVQRY
jgi:hypothetical protein